MLDGQQPDFKTYMAANEETGKAVTFVALNKTEAKEMMEKEGLLESIRRWLGKPLRPRRWKRSDSRVPWPADAERNLGNEQHRLHNVMRHARK